MSIVTGDNLTPATQAQVLRTFVHRLTVENVANVARYTNYHPSYPTPTDKQWLADHAFHIKADGSLDRRYSVALPAYLAD